MTNWKVYDSFKSAILDGDLDGFNVMSEVERVKCPTCNCNTHTKTKTTIGYDSIRIDKNKDDSFTVSLRQEGKDIMRLTTPTMLTCNSVTIMGLSGTTELLLS